MDIFSGEGIIRCLLKVILIDLFMRSILILSGEVRENRFGDNLWLMGTV